MRWVAKAPPLGSHRTATPTVWAFSAILPLHLYSGLLNMLKLNHIGCNAEIRRVYAGLTAVAKFKRR